MSTTASGSHVSAATRGAAVKDAASNAHPSAVRSAAAYGCICAAVGPRVTRTSPSITSTTSGAAPKTAAHHVENAA